MALNVGESHAALRIIDHLTGHPRNGHAVTREQAIDALELLADGAAKRLLVGRGAEARARLEQHWPELADLIRYTHYLPGINAQERLALWCDECDYEAQGPIWTDEEAAEQITPVSVANLLAICDDHERARHGGGR